MVATGSTLEEANGQKAALNMAKFIKGQSLDLLGQLEELEMDALAGLLLQAYLLAGSKSIISGE